MFNVTQWRTTTRASPSWIRDRNHWDFAPSWPEAACSRPGFLRDYAPMGPRRCFLGEAQAWKMPMLQPPAQHDERHNYYHRCDWALHDMATCANGILAGFGNVFEGAKRRAVRRERSKGAAERHDKGRSPKAPARLVREPGREGGGKSRPDHGLPTLTFWSLNVVNVRLSVFKTL